MVSSNLLLQELNSKKGELPNVEDVHADDDRTESESFKDY